MKTIEIDDDVYVALKKRVTGFRETESQVIRRLLGAVPNNPQEGDGRMPACLEPRGVDKNHPLVALINGPRYQTLSSIDRYMVILGFLQKEDPKRFASLDGLRRGSRVQIASEEAKILESGESTKPKRIPDSGYYVVTNLDNRTKRAILADSMGILGYPPDLIAAAAASIPDSGISRPRSRALPRYI